MSEMNWKTPLLKNLFEAISTLDSSTDVADFMRDVATISELSEMAKRWEAVMMLTNKVPYRTIAQKIGLSTTTVSRVAYWFNNGTGGYKKAIENVTHQHHHTGVGRGGSSSH
jgi:TrpR-related protein YerC/YecD